MSQQGIIQPLNYNPTQVASAAGAATWTLPLLAAGEMWEFTINCPVAPSTARITINAGGNVLGYVKGSNSWGPIQIQGGEQLVINATGLIPGTTYYLNVIGVVVNGGSGLEEKYPAAYSDTVTTGVESIGLGQVSVTGATGTSIGPLTIPSTVRYVWILVSTTTIPTSVYIQLVLGSGLFAFQGIPFQTTSNAYFYRIPVYFGASTTGTVIVNYPSSTSGVIEYGFDLQSFETLAVTSPLQSFHNVPYGGAQLAQLVNNPGGTILAAPGAGQSYRLHSVSVYTPNNVGGDRFTFYEGGSNNIIATLFYGSKESEQMNGQLVTSLVGVTPSHVIATVFNVYYDVVTTPTIS